MCVCVCVSIIFFMLVQTEHKDIFRLAGLRRDLYFLNLFIYFDLIYVHVSSLLLSSENRNGTRPR